MPLEITIEKAACSVFPRGDLRSGQPRLSRGGSGIHQRFALPLPGRCVPPGYNAVDAMHSQELDRPTRREMRQLAEFHDFAG
jgi:hypothetical protein